MNIHKGDPEVSLRWWRSGFRNWRRSDLQSKVDRQRIVHIEDLSI